MEIQPWLRKTIQITYATFLGIILFTLFFCSNFEYPFAQEFLQPNLVLALIGLLFLFLLTGLPLILRKKWRLPLKIPYRRIVIILSVILLLWQIYVLYNIYFGVGWDAGTLSVVAHKISAGLPLNIQDNNYYSTYPNNCFLATVYALILKLNSIFGIFTGHQDIMSLSIINCVLNTAACLLVFHLLSRFLNEKYAFGGFLLCVVLVGLSPWIAVYYSDSVGLIFPLLMLEAIFFNAKSRRTRILHYFAIVFLAIFGYFIKPQTLIVLLAYLAIKFIDLLSKKQFRQLGCFAGAIAIGLVFYLCSSQLMQGVYARSGFHFNPEREDSMIHFFMMGLNDESHGGWRTEDAVFAESFDSKQERNSAEWQRAKERIGAFGVGGLVDHLVKKTVTNYNDGTFAWRKEGEFFAATYDPPNSRASNFLRSFFYDDGSRRVPWQTWCQFFWLTTLMLCFFAGLGGIKRHGFGTILFLSIIGLTLFELIFEARARYLYIYVPFFCMLAMYGLYHFQHTLERYYATFCQRRAQSRPKPDQKPHQPKTSKAKKS